MYSINSSGIFLLLAMQSHSKLALQQRSMIKLYETMKKYHISQVESNPP